MFAIGENKMVGVEEEVMPNGFLLLKCVGLWRPMSWTNNRHIVAYKMYTAINLLLMSASNFLEFTNVVLYSESFDNVVKDDISIKLSRLNETFRSSVLLSKRDKVIGLINNCIDQRWRIGRDEGEDALHEKFRWLRKWTSTGYIFFILVSFSSAILRRQTDTEESQMTLPISAWYPYNMSIPRNFWISFTHYSLGSCPIVVGHVANAGIVSGFMLHVCAQIELLKYRIVQLPEMLANAKRKGASEDELEEFERIWIIERVHDHQSILSFVKNVNGTFAEVQFVQFFISMLMLCTSVYQLSRESIASVSFVTMLTFMGTTFGLLFLYCWCGTQITSSSSEISNAIFEISECGLSIRSKKNLLMMMLGSRESLRMSGGSIIVWDINSFITVLKASYSAFNVLQRTSA